MDELSLNPLFPEAFIYDLSLSESNLKAYGDGSEDSKVLELFLAYAETLYECHILITWLFTPWIVFSLFEEDLLEEIWIKFSTSFELLRM